jgi:hypothetical protein
MEHKVSLPCLQEPAARIHPDPNEFSPYRLLRSVSILAFHLRPSPQRGLLHLYSRTKYLYELFVSPMSTTFLAHLILLDSIILIIFLKVKIMDLLIVQFSLFYIILYCFTLYIINAEFSQTIHIHVGAICVFRTPLFMALLQSKSSWSKMHIKTVLKSQRLHLKIMWNQYTERFLFLYM